MKEYYLSGAEITSRAQLHEALADAMDFPEYYGGDLDALLDVLTDIFEDTCLHITECAQLEATLENYYCILVKVLTAASRENEHFTFTLE